MIFKDNTTSKLTLFTLLMHIPGLIVNILVHVIPKNIIIWLSLWTTTKKHKCFWLTSGMGNPLKSVSSKCFQFFNNYINNLLITFKEANIMHWKQSFLWHSTFSLQWRMNSDVHEKSRNHFVWVFRKNWSCSE